VTRIRPPESLPSAYVEIWTALREADSEAASRQALARRLGVSTHTLQRILVRGDVPRFPEESSVRVVHSWVRTLSRIAACLERNPRAWIETVGISWTERIRKISEASIRGMRERSGRTDGSVKTPGPLPGVLHACAVDRPDFCASLPDLGVSFLEALIRRLLGSIAPGVEIRIESIPEAEALVALAGPSPRIDVAAGILDTIDRRRRGLAFVPIPGWSVRLEATCLGRKEIAPRFSRWGSWTHPACALPIVASHGGVAHAYLSGASGVSGARLRILSSNDPAELAHALIEEALRSPEGAAILAGDGGSPGAAPREGVQEMLENDARLAGDWVILGMEDAAAAPAFPLAIAAGEGAQVSVDLIRGAMEREMFQAGVVPTAQLYAAFAAASHRPIEEFPGAGGSFRQAACDALVALVRPPEYARILIPIAWQPHLDAALRGDLDPILPSVSRHQCQSCSASLDDGLHGGASDRYCRFCSDEQGRLRPREEVQGVIARWLRNWQEGIPEPEAMRRAAVFMQAMPAWNRN
jgi:hypothetical protein